MRDTRLLVLLINELFSDNFKSITVEAYLESLSLNPNGYSLYSIYLQVPFSHSYRFF